MSSPQVPNYSLATEELPFLLIHIAYLLLIPQQSIKFHLHRVITAKLLLHLFGYVLIWRSRHQPFSSYPDASNYWKTLFVLRFSVFVWDFYMNLKVFSDDSKLALDGILIIICEVVVFLRIYITIGNYHLNLLSDWNALVRSSVPEMNVMVIEARVEQFEVTRWS